MILFSLDFPVENIFWKIVEKNGLILRFGFFFRRWKTVWLVYSLEKSHPNIR